MNGLEVIEALSALAHDSGLAVYRPLAKGGPAGMLASELADRLGVPVRGLPLQVKTLACTGVITKSGRNRFTHYSANFERLNGLVAYLTEDCCRLGSTCES